MSLFRSVLTYLHYIKINVIMAFAYRFDTFVSLITKFIILLSMVYIWKYAYKGINQVQGVVESEMITYTIISMLLSSLFQFSVQYSFKDKVVSGEIAVDFIRPVNILLSQFFSDIGQSVNTILLSIIPLLGISFFLIQPPLPISTEHLLLFFASTALSYLILWLISALVSVTAFWVMELGDLGMVKDAIVRILSGSLVPLWFFPDWFQQISIYMPFQYIYQTPLSIYIGKIGYKDASQAMIIQCVWIVLLFLTLVALWKRASRKVLFQGG